VPIVQEVDDVGSGSHQAETSRVITLEEHFQRGDPLHFFPEAQVTLSANAPDEARELPLQGEEGGHPHGADGRQSALRARHEWC